MTSGQKPYVLASFRVDRDGQCWATLIPPHDGTEGAKAMEVHCPRAVMKLLPHMQSQWARMEAEKRCLWA
jgi:hypothetical protein